MNKRQKYLYCLMFLKEDILKVFDVVSKICFHSKLNNFEAYRSLKVFNECQLCVVLYNLNNYISFLNNDWAWNFNHQVMLS